MQIAATMIHIALIDSSRCSAMPPSAKAPSTVTAIQTRRCSISRLRFARRESCHACSINAAFTETRRYGRDVVRGFVEEPPGSLGPVAGVIDTDACCAPDAHARHGLRPFDPERITEKACAIEAAVDVHCAAKKAWAPSFVRNVGDWLQRTEQYRLWHAFTPRDDVDAIPEAVDQIHIGAAGGAEHHLGALGSPARGMRCQIVRTQVRFGLHDPADATNVRRRP